MTARTVEDHVSALLSQSVAGTKSVRTPATALEASAIFGSIAMSLMLRPRAALYFEYLARNGLSKTVQDELNVLNALSSLIHDLGNISYKLEGAGSLSQARTALLQLEMLPRIGPDSAALSTFERSVQDFLDKNLSRNVRRRGVGDLVRPSAEALVDLPSMLQSAKDAHAATLERLYTLAVGVENFIAAPFAAILGTAAISKARSDLEEILAQVSGGGDPSGSRDYAVRLISSKATIKTIANPPGIFDPVMPASTIATSPPVAPSATSVPGPFSLEPTATFSIDSVALTFFSTNYQLQFSSEIAFPTTLDGNLFVSIGGADPVAIPVAGTFTSAELLAQAITAGGIAASWFPGSVPRIILFDTHEFVIRPTAFVDDPASTTDSQKLLTNSVHEALGLPLGVASHSLLSAEEVAELLSPTFPTYTFTANPDATLSITSWNSAAGATLTLDMPPSFGMTGTFRAESADLSLGVDDHTVEVQVGDLVDDFVVEEVFVDRVALSAPVPTFSKAVSVRSPLALLHTLFAADLKKFLDSWVKTSFSKDLAVLDRALAPLLASQSPAQRNDAMSVLTGPTGLITKLTTLLNLLNDTSTMLQPGAAQEERRTVEGILSTLTERNYDRAVDRLLMCDLQSLLEMNEDSASYAGSFLRASSDFAQAGGIEQTVDVDATTAVSAGA